MEVTMKNKNFKFSVSEVVLTGGRKKSIKVDVDGRNVLINVDEHLFARWDDQFVRKNPSKQQRGRFVTTMNLIRAAYKKGLADGTNQRKN
jgi:hypothetical protein